MSYALWFCTYLPPMFFDDNLKAKMLMFELWHDAKRFEWCQIVPFTKGLDPKRCLKNFEMYFTYFMVGAEMWNTGHENDFMFMIYFDGVSGLRPAGIDAKCG